MTGPIALQSEHALRADRRSGFEDVRSDLELRLRALAPAEDRSDALAEAIRYALLAPGKRLRPMLLVLAVRECGGIDRVGIEAACAVEMVHAASLILDDLPAMDDAIARRGRPATHIAYGEAVAILAAVSLIASAFAVVADAGDHDDGCRTRMAAILARTIGHRGLAGGQHADLSRTVPPRALERIVETNHRKTGSIFVAAVEIAGVVAGADPATVERLVRYAGHLGQAFQLLDDLEDGETETEEDAGKATLVAAIGRAGVRLRLATHLRQALAELEPGGDLALFTRGIFDREPLPDGIAALVDATGP